MSESKKESNIINKYEKSYRNYTEYLIKLADIAFKNDTKANLLVDGDISREMRLYAVNQQIEDLKNIRMAFEQIKKYNIEQLHNKLAYFHNLLKDDSIGIDDQTTNLNAAELLNGCIKLYTKMRLQ